MPLEFIRAVGDIYWLLFDLLLPKHTKVNTVTQHLWCSQENVRLKNMCSLTKQVATACRKFTATIIQNATVNPVPWQLHSVSTPQHRLLRRDRTAFKQTFIFTSELSLELGSNIVFRKSWNKTNYFVSDI